MAADLTATRYTQFRTIEQALLAASFAGVAGADDGAREFELLKRELESPPTPHWVDAFIKRENAILTGGVLD